MTDPGGNLKKILPALTLALITSGLNAQERMETNPEKIPSLNVFGEKLIPCSTDPLTGYFRDGCCSTGPTDRGTHTVCAVMTAEFLEFSKSQGNDLITPLPAYRFPGLKPDDKWCLCILRWEEARKAGVAPKVLLEATHEKSIEYVPLETLVKFAWKGNPGRN
ncbi:MAG TPA: DUF2237 domain-containing protein [Cryomorphaceae bacterium]|nr:DUF2237 domain-containing protein [Cryomorphaceae bacterium]